MQSAGKRHRSLVLHGPGSDIIRKQLKTGPPVPLGLNRWFPIGIRRMIWSYLSWFDKDMIRRAHNSRRRWYNWLEIEMVRKNYFNLLKWAYRHGMKLTTLSPLEAVMEGNLGILQWLIVQGVEVEIRKECCYVATTYGHLHIIEWLFSENVYFPPLSDILTCGIKHGQLPIVKWAVQSGASFNVHVCLELATDQAVIDYLHSIRW